MTKKVSKESLGITNEKITELKKVIPEVFTEGKIDFEKLQRTLGKEINGKDEKYSFNWAGRKETFKNIQTTAKGTLKPAEKESINWDSTENLFIEGDNLEVLKLLQKVYFNKIKMIYIDPPYNTGKDFVYKDNFKNSIQSYLEQTGQLNGDGVKLTTNPETNGRFHSDWISMIYPRLFIARNLLREDGVIFVSIDDNEVHNLRKVMDEIFGEENFIACITREAIKGGSQSKFLRVTHDYVLVFAKDINEIEFSGIESEGVELNLKDEKGAYAKGRELNKWGAGSRREDAPGMWYSIKGPKGEEVYPIRNDGTEGRWRLGKKKMTKLVEEGNVIFEKRKNGSYVVYQKIRDNSPRIKQFISIFKDKYINAKGTEAIKKLFKIERAYFDYSKPVELIYDLMVLADVDDEDIVLDFFAGSATTAQAVLEYNRDNDKECQFICIQLPEKTAENSIAQKAGYENIADISKERIKKIIKQLEKENKGKLVKKNHLDLGFKVFKLDKSNYKIWEKYEGKDAKELKKQLELFKTPLISGYKNEDVIYECMIKEGYSLNSKIEKTGIKSNKVFKVSDGDLFFYVCLDQEIKDKTINELKLKKENMFICLDEALNDSKKKNLSIQCNLKVI